MAGSGTGDVSPAKKIKCGTDAIVIPQLPIEKIKLLREAILALDDSVLFGYSLIKITKSNAEMCCPFQKCFVKFERSCDKNQPEPERKIVYNFAGVFEKGVNILNQHLEDPGKVSEVKEMRLALLRLTRTILTIDDIGEKLARQLSTPDKERETAWCISLVHHLLKELSVNQQYRIDMFSEFINDTCSGCSEPIGDYGHYDDCSLGNSKVWHGNVDILLGHHPSVAVYAKDDDPTGSEIDGSLSSFEVNDNCDLINDRSQIISEAIVFALLQKKCNPSFDNYLIPTVGISKSDILFYLYDPEHDILLESPPFNIFEPYASNSLELSTVLALWFILNYKTFCTGITVAMKERNFTADFLSHVDSGIKSIYKEHLQFGDCGTGSIKPVYHKPTEGAGWQLKKSRPFKSSFNASEGPDL